ncbi:flippase-like domain-containing protein [Candidatus Saccharibacteria bacterium]|nr:MAG: flippase-like domain-containing protein [Candidatus Saccharibacteria bacterium]
MAFRRLKLRELLIVELAAAFINRLIPSGLGGLGVHGLYLHKRRHSVAEATAVVSINNLLGMSVHLLLLGFILVAGSAGQLHLGWSQKQGWVLLGIGFVIGAALLMRRARRIVIRFVRNLLVSLRRYERQPHRLVYAALHCALLRSPMCSSSIWLLVILACGSTFPAVSRLHRWRLARCGRTDSRRSCGC